MQLNFSITDTAVQNSGDYDKALSPGRTIVIGVNEKIPDTDHHEEE
jgi:hypothetical protein